MPALPIPLRPDDSQLEWTAVRGRVRDSIVDLVERECCDRELIKRPFQKDPEGAVNLIGKLSTELGRVFRLPT
jgi:hypothetical protein